LKKDFVYMNPDTRLQEENSAFSGPVASLQPNISVEGWPCDAGSAALENYVALEDATVTERLKEGGFFIKGFTRMSELGFGLRRDTAAGAVCDGKADIAFMTDTMGESRVAASLKGLFGYKPSYGVVSRYGLIGLVPSMECYGMVSSSIENISKAVRSISGFDIRDPSMPDETPPDFNITMDMRKPTVGFLSQCMALLDEEEKEAFTASLDTAREAGIGVVELGFDDFSLMADVHNVIGSVEASSSGGKYDSVRYGHRAKSDNNWNDMYIKSRSESFGSIVKAYMLQGGYFQYKAYSDFESACRIRARIIQKTNRLFEKADLIVMPSRRRNPSIDIQDSIRDIYETFTFSLYANLTGGPAVSVPGLAVSEDTDIGFQILGPIREDGRVLSLASALTAWINRKGAR
jgi:aspartyl-tRNA(Asn)/glutamyl-tRNA(Gln) amidotransferase subunit A